MGKKTIFCGLILPFLLVGLGNGYTLRHQPDIAVTYPENGKLRWKLEGLYNRVQGLFLYGGPTLQGPPSTKVRLSFNLGYGFADHRWAYRLHLRRQLSRWWGINLTGYDEIFSQDRWLLSIEENTLFSALIKEDFMDYYQRSGGSIGFSLKFTEWIHLQFCYQGERERGVSKSTNWALFRRERNFRDNPAIREGLLRSGILRVKLDRVRDGQNRLQGWQISANYQRGGEDFDFSRYQLEFRLYQGISIREEIDFRLRAGAINGNNLPEQFLFDLGGIGSLRGYGFKEFSNGERVLLANLEYRFSSGGWLEPAGIWFLESLQIIPFYDLGLIWDSGEEVRLNKLKNDIGLGISGGTRDDFRLNFAWRLDREEKFRVGLRLQRIF